MANQERGEYAVKVGERVYTLRPTLNAMCEAEALTGLSTVRLMQQSAEGLLSATRTLIWAYLQEHHAAEIKSLRDAGKWIDAAGGIDAVNAAIEKLEQLNVDDTPQTKGGEGSGNPPPAQDGTGENSSLRLVESA